jgi:hypothetical protein
MLTPTVTYIGPAHGIRPAAPTAPAKRSPREAQ